MIKFELNESLIEEFNNNGFLILDNFLYLNYIEDLRNKFEPLFKGNFETGIELNGTKIGKDLEDVTRQI